MARITRPLAVDKARFDSASRDRDALYGLPEEIVFCSACTVSNQMPGPSVEFSAESERKTTTGFGENGICQGCQAIRAHQSIDWASREEELRRLCDQFRSRNGSHDCIVPGSGGKDSVMASGILRDEYGMHPLTVTWAPNVFTDWGHRNFERWISDGFDNFLVTQNPSIHRLLTRLSLDTLLHPFQPFMMGQKSIAPRLALKFGIPLVFYGEPASDYGASLEGESSALMDPQVFSCAPESDLYIAGHSVSTLESDFDLDLGSLNLYTPLDAQEVTAAGLQVHYLGYYLPWHPQACYYYAIDQVDFEPSPNRNCGTYSRYASLDDKLDDFHYYTTYTKFGIGRATYDTAHEIRWGDLSREEGVALVHSYDGEYPSRWMTELFSYLSMDDSTFTDRVRSQFESPSIDEEYFINLVDSFRSPHLWNLSDDGWSLRARVS